MPKNTKLKIKALVWLMQFKANVEIAPVEPLQSPKPTQKASPPIPLRPAEPVNPSPSPITSRPIRPAWR